MTANIHSSITDLFFEPDVWMRIEFLLNARGLRHEFTLYLIPHKEHPNLIVDFVIPRQRCTQTHTSPELSDVGDFLVTHNPSIFWWLHTHPDMTAKPSSDDWDTFNHFTNPSRPCAMVIWAANKERSKTCSLRIPLPNQPCNPSLALNPATYVEVTLSQHINDASSFYTNPKPLPIDQDLLDLDGAVSQPSSSRTTPYGDLDDLDGVFTWQTPNIDLDDAHRLPPHIQRLFTQVVSDYAGTDIKTFIGWYSKDLSFFLDPESICDVEDLFLACCVFLMLSPADARTVIETEINFAKSLLPTMRSSAMLPDQHPRSKELLTYIKTESVRV